MTILTCKHRVHFLSLKKWATKDGQNAETPSFFCVFDVKTANFAPFGLNFNPFRSTVVIII
jgi:hypothetical protein